MYGILSSKVSSQVPFLFYFLMTKGHALVMFVCHCVPWDSSCYHLFNVKFHASPEILIDVICINKARYGHKTSHQHHRVIKSKYFEIPIEIKNKILTKAIYLISHLDDWTKWPTFCRRHRLIFRTMTSSNLNIFRVLPLWAGNSPVTGEFPPQRLVTQSFDVFCDLRLNQRQNATFSF